MVKAMTGYVPIRSQLIGGERPVESLVEVILRDLDGPGGRSDRKLIRDILGFNLENERVVVLGGGTGLSTVVGGNSLLPEWSRRPFVGLKEEFPSLKVAVVTTDDGGSTGLLLRQLPMIGIGDLRKSCLSLIRGRNLARRYRLEDDRVRPLVGLIQAVFNHRFPPQAVLPPAIRRDPLRAVKADWSVCPPELQKQFRHLASFLTGGPSSRRIEPAGHCLGNLILTAAIFTAAGGDFDRSPGLKAVREGVDRVCGMIGAEAGVLHAVTATPGQLRFRYANGVEVYGQRKASLAARGSPVERVTAEFISSPKVSRSLLRAIGEATVIIFAPGSLYSSMIPLLQIPAILAAVRDNRSALKVLAASFWRQEGETDLSFHPGSRGFSVSETIEAFARNLPGGVEGVFDVVLGANLEHIPAHILRNYALEGKLPIYLDRDRVSSRGIRPVEAVLFPLLQLDLLPVIQHDPENFALAVRTLCYWRRQLTASRPARFRPSSGKSAPATGGFLPCRRFGEIKKILGGKKFQEPILKDVLLELAWENRDIPPEHFNYMKGATVIPARDWKRSREWDIIMGFFDPTDFYLKAHRRLLKNPARLRQDLLISLGESLLGRYLARSEWSRKGGGGCPGARFYRIRLLPPSRRRCAFTSAQLERYLALARLVPEAGDRSAWRMTVNDDEGFITPGLLFGLLYAWYLNNSYGRIIEYEMSLLTWPTSSLLPYQVRERERKQQLVKFFRTEVFAHRE